MAHLTLKIMEMVYSTVARVDSFFIVHFVCVTIPLEVFFVVVPNDLDKALKTAKKKKICKIFNQ